MNVATVSVLTSGAIGFAGIVVVGINARADRRLAQKLAREEREQRRLEQCYLELLTTCERMGYWAQLVLPMVEPVGVVVELPEPPDSDSQARIGATVRAIGSSEVQELYNAWSEAAWHIVQVHRAAVTTAAVPGLLQDTEVARDLFERRMELEQTLRPAELTARVALSERVNVELMARSTRP